MVGAIRPGPHWAAELQHRQPPDRFNVHRFTEFWQSSNLHAYHFGGVLPQYRSARVMSHAAKSSRTAQILGARHGRGTVLN